MIECPHSIYFFRGDVENFDMEQATNTLKDWFLVPLSRPVIAPPKQKLQTVNIPGANGVLDLSNSLTHYPVFENRTGNLKFAVLNDKPGHDWLTVYTKIMKFLQGNNVKMFLEDDTKFYYEGRVYVDDWDSKNDGTWSEISLGYDLQPYRRAIYSSVDDWLWDPFNFENGVIREYSNIEVDGTKEIVIVGSAMPVVPTIIVQSENGDGIDLTYGGTQYHLTDGKNKIVTMTLLETEQTIIFDGIGVVSIEFREGSL
jgi:hypothetical protein